jgi:hypothetical protein
LLEQDLHEIEDRLRDQEDRLQTQKLALESEIRDRDLRVRHWQLELRAKQVCTSIQCGRFVCVVSGAFQQEVRGSGENVFLTSCQIIISVYVMCTVVTETCYKNSRFRNFV